MLPFLGKAGGLHFKQHFPGRNFNYLLEGCGAVPCSFCASRAPRLTGLQGSHTTRYKRNPDFIVVPLGDSSANWETWISGLFLRKFMHFFNIK